MRKQHKRWRVRSEVAASLKPKIIAHVVPPSKPTTNPLFTTVLIASCAVTTGARGQNGINISAMPTAWQACANLTGDSEARLICFDRWAAQQPSAAASRPPSPGRLGAGADADYARSGTRCTRAGDDHHGSTGRPQLQKQAVFRAVAVLRAGSRQRLRHVWHSRISPHQPVVDRF